MQDIFRDGLLARLDLWRVRRPVVRGNGEAKLPGDPFELNLPAVVRKGVMDALARGQESERDPWYGSR